MPYIFPSHATGIPTGLTDVEVASIESSTSTEFIETVFNCYAERRVFAISRTDADVRDLVCKVATITLSQKTIGWVRPRYEPFFSDAPAQIVFTSGTEGKPKAIVLSHRNLADVVQRLNTAMQVTDEIREYVGVPVTYSFGLGRVRAVAAAGGAAFLPERFDPIEIRRMLADGEINAISAVPSLWRVILAAPETLGDMGDRVRWIEIGSQFMAGEEKAAMKRLFPNARILQHYGLTEASRSTLLDITTTSDDDLDSVGSAVGSVHLKINAEGAICIRGDHVALGQLHPGGEITPLTDADGWLVTKDRGEIRNNRLHYLGRLDDQINVSGIKIGAEALEREIAKLAPDLDGRFAVTAIHDQMRGNAVLLGVESSAGDRGTLLEAAARIALERRGIASGGVLQILRLENLPRTGTNKIQRNALSEAYQNRSATPSSDTHALGDDPAALSEAEQAVLTVWRRVLGDIHISADHSFFDVGGDSLSSVQLGLVMETGGFSRAAIRATLEGRPVAEIARLGETEHTDSPPKTRSLPSHTVKGWALNITRGFMVLSVLLSHWGPGFFGRLGVAEPAERILSILYRMGTPGFAVVFGIGIGLYMIPQVSGKYDSVLWRTRTSFLLVAGGLCLSALIHLTLSALQGQTIGGLAISNAFYSVLAYYAVILGTARFWLPWLGRRKQPILTLITLGLALWIGWRIAPFLLPETQIDSLLEWPRLMSVAGYNVFKMTMVACFGAAIGLWLTQQTDMRQTGRVILATGLLGSGLCLFTLLEGYGMDAFASRFNPAFVSLPGQVLYVCLVLTALGGNLLLVRNWHGLSTVLLTVLQVLTVVGGLALPIYVFHGLVIPMKDLLEIFGVHGAPALAAPMSLFLLSIGYAGNRLYRMYFPRAN